LNFISEADKIRYFFIKNYNNETNAHQCGYYQVSSFGQLAKDVAQVDGRASGIYYTLNAIDQALCPKPNLNSLVSTRFLKSPKNENIIRRRMLLVDIDPVREPNCSASDDEKSNAYDLALLVYRNLKKEGWPKPVVVDSGNGYHLLYKIYLPADDGGLVRNCLLALAGKYNIEKAKIDTSVHDAARIAKLPGTMACKGLSSQERPHRRSGFFKLPAEFKVVSQELLTKLAGSWQANSPRPSTEARHPLVESSPELILGARAYLAKMGPAISGKKGRNQFFNAACRLVDDFALSREHALPLLQEYNQRCIPPFNDYELDDKLDSALAKVVERDGPSGSKIGSLTPELAPSGPRFVGYVPDFGHVTTNYVFFNNEKSAPFGGMLAIFILWNRLDPYPLIPDVLLRQLVWGATYDKNWKARLPKKKKLLGNVRPIKDNKVCSAERCMLHGTGIFHRHYSVSFLNYPILSSFLPKNDDKYIQGDRFKLYSDEFKVLREDLQRSGMLFSVYWPAFILGGSPKVGWTWSQQLLVMGMVRELTRTKAKRGEGITGEIVKGGLVATTSTTMPSKLVSCPLLNFNSEYVVFAGNGRRKGQGYRIIGQTDKGWLHRSGYNLPAKDPLGDSNEKRLECMRLFLTDLDFLSQKLDLVPVGILKGEWKNIGEMMDCARSERGQDWLEACTLRIFTLADWRKRWRQYFSNKLGFAWIPETHEDSGAATPNGALRKLGGTISAHEVRCFLENLGWTQRQLAEEIIKISGRSCSLRRVERNLSINGPSADFQRDFTAVRAKVNAVRHV